MMLYLYLKKDGDVKRIGADCDLPESIQEAMKPWSENGYDMADPSEYDTQVINGAMAGSIPDPNLPTSEGIVNPGVEQPSVEVPVVAEQPVSEPVSE